MVMRGKPHVFLVLLLIALAAGVAGAAMGQGGTELDESSVADRRATVETRADAIAVELASTAGWRMDDESGVPDRLRPGVMHGDRQVIVDDIVHYSFLVRTGCGPRDVIGLHRVVKERRRFVPIRTSKSIFLQHGDGKTFTGMFLPGQLSPHTDDDFGIAVFLAQNDVDVWGIDQAWTLVPADTTDLAFMETWGLQRQVDDLSLDVPAGSVYGFIGPNGSGKTTTLRMIMNIFYPDSGNITCLLYTSDAADERVRV